MSFPFVIYEWEFIEKNGIMVLLQKIGTKNSSSMASATEAQLLKLIKKKNLIDLRKVSRSEELVDEIEQLIQRKKQTSSHAFKLNLLIA